MNRQPLIYVIGPYRSTTEWGVYHNINQARGVAYIGWQHGAAMICPHSNTAFMGGLTGNDEDFLRGDLRIMESCDACVLVDGWAGSSGSKGEIDHAKENGILVLANSAAMVSWLETHPWIVANRNARYVAKREAQGRGFCE